MSMSPVDTYIGYEYAGLQYSRHCFCGYDYGRHGSMPDSQCDRTCAGNTNEYCGDFDRMSVYKTVSGVLEKLFSIKVVSKII